MKKNGYPIKDRTLFYDCCYDFLRDPSRQDGTDMDSTFNDVFDRDSSILSCKKEFVSGTITLL